MKKQIIIASLFFAFASLTMQLYAQSARGKTMTKKETKKWFNQKDWLNGAQLTPHKSINQSEFARQYHLNKTYWDKAFTYLKEQNLKTLEKGRHPIDGDNVYASVTEDSSKNFDKTNWESHRKYIDLQCIITGEEKMGVYPVAKATVTKDYDEKRDVANYSAEGKFYVGTAGTFFIFFPSDAHRPNITPGGNKPVKKIVIKIRVAE